MAVLAAVTVSAQTPAPPAPQLANSSGVGDLLVAPTRLILTNRARAGEFALINVGNAPATYRISMMKMRMTESGELKELPAEETLPASADSLIRYSPREVTLEPHVSQTVRLQLRLPAELAAGEYRSHILFRAVPPATDPNVPAGSQDSGVTIRLTPVYGVSVPIVVRNGDTSATVTLSDLAITRVEGNPVVSLKVNRAGSRSVYGNIVIRFTANGGKEHVVGMSNGVAVYTEVTSRSVLVPLQPPTGVVLRDGTLRVTYTDAEVPNGQLLAQAELRVL